MTELLLTVVGIVEHESRVCIVLWVKITDAYET